ncbi:peptidase S41 [Pontibacter sp. FD36]|uniref:S41 family peptidase n=1 Tax=Pontibacter sp. FD36 TaxID=2789860 RepID=UPI0018AAF4AB|nr:S41 family peptidase [Pontibacter sp. FD36]MBF8964610.1 peptidase S41 [Pontibacter sp. FD36]
MKQLHLCILIILSLFSGCTTSSPNFQNIYISDLVYDPAEYLANFKEIHAIVESKHPYLTSKGIHKDSLFKKYSALIARAGDNKMYGKLVLEYFSELQNGHSSVYFRRDFINCDAALIENRLFFTSVREEDFIKAGIKERDEIIEIDGLPVLEWLERETTYVYASTSHGRRALTVSNNLFRSYFKDTRRYLIQTSDSLKEISVHFDKSAYIPVPGYTLISGKSLTDQAGYIAINGMKDDVAEQFLEHYFKFKDKPYLIIDLRNNGGGNSALGEKMAAYLIKKKHTASVSTKSISPIKDSYKGKLYVLTSGYTFSSAESFAIDLMEGGDATLIGTPTHGDTGNGATNFVTSKGLAFRIPTRKPRVSSGGFPMEGKSIPPTHLVETSAADLLNGEDTVLNYTLDLIEQGPLLKVGKE